ncbi:YrhC family protein [Shouchella patagoniensis]|uniref:YrhC family protein n=1 Tax=Shouchella patagoniensis TaxID=228576 RepID=UPI000994F9A3|nr:YrhC family protein [Shouchella patagoniensis]
MEKEIKSLKFAQQDYQAYSIVFLAVSIFLTIGLWLPAPYRIETTVLFACVIGASLVFSLSCYGLSCHAKKKLEKQS